MRGPATADDQVCMQHGRTNPHDPREDGRARELALSGVAGAGRRRSVGGLFRRALDIFLSTLREIFDESAYARFLSRQKLHSSRAAYAAFLRESQRQREKRPRCC